MAPQQDPPRATAASWWSATASRFSPRRICSATCPGVPLTVNAEGGYNSFQIFDLFRESYDPSQSVIVFDAGTNDNPAYPEILAGNLKKVAATIGNRCMVVPTIHGLTVNGVDNDGKNRVVEAFAASRPGTQVPDWANVVATHPELMQADNLHPIAEGAQFRARIIASGVKACLSPPVRAAPAPPPVAKPPPVEPPQRSPAPDTGLIFVADVMRLVATFVQPQAAILRNLLGTLPVMARQ